MTASTWTWLGTTNNPQLSSNWTLTAGPGNSADRPQSGDTAIVPGGTPQSPLVLDSHFTSTTLDVVGSGGFVFSNNSTSDSNSSINSTSTIVSTGTAATLLLEGPFANYGTIAVTGAQDSLAVAISAGSAASGTLVNNGQVMVDGGTLSITGGTIAGNGSITVMDGSALITGVLAGQSYDTIGQNGTLELNQSGIVGTSSQVTFDNDGSPALLKIDQPGQFAGSFSGIDAGATIDLGIVNITTIEFDNSGDLIAIGSGGTVFEANVGNFDTPGSTTSFTMSGTGGVAGDFQVTEGGGHDTTLTLLAATTWLWKSGASASGGTASDWSVYSGPGNGWNLPEAGDSAIDAGGTILFGDDPQLVGNTLYVGGTIGCRQWW